MKTSKSQIAFVCLILLFAFVATGWAVEKMEQNTAQKSGGLSSIRLPYYFKKLYYGIGFGPVIGGSGSNPFRFQSVAFIRHPLYHFVQGELALGLNGLSSGTADRISLNRFDYKVLVGLENLYNFDVWKPYAYLGLGQSRYNIWVPDFYGPKYKGNMAYVPFGIGTYFRFQDLVAFDASIGYNVFLKRKADYAQHGPKGYLTLQVGVSLVGSRDLSDWDKDGLIYRDERLNHSNPRNPDSDMDELNDRDEVLVFNTNPNKPDSDEDGILDNLEVQSYHTDPNSADTDADGLTDAKELFTYSTDPLKADSDNDQLNDYVELEQYRTDPLKADTDADSLNDYIEVMQYKTDPKKQDSDDGGIKDFAEISRGSDPLDGSDDILPKGKPIVLAGIFFEYKSARIDTAASQVLKKVAESLTAHPEIRVEIQGHTDNVGSRRYNLKLSNDRAEAVETYLIRLSVPAECLRHAGLGFDFPRADNATEEGRSLNRRIEFVRLDTLVKVEKPITALQTLDLKTGEALVLEGVYFDYKSTAINEPSRQVLANVVRYLQDNPGIVAEIQGHSDMVGSRAYNLTLSTQRAEAVRDYLVARGLDAARLQARGYAFDKPRAVNDTPQGRQLNRRIELVRLE